MNMPNESIHLNRAAVHTGLLIDNQDRVGEGALLRVVSPVTLRGGMEAEGGSTDHIVGTHSPVQALGEP